MLETDQKHNDVLIYRVYIAVLINEWILPSS